MNYSESSRCVQGFPNVALPLVRLPVRLFLICVASACVCLGSTGAAEAGSVSFTTQSDSHTQAGFLPLFDPSLGQLTTVIVQGNGNVGATFIPDEAVSSATVYGFIAVSGIISAPDGSQRNVDLGSGDSTTDYSFNPPSSFGIDASVNISYTQTITAGLTDYYGSEMMNIAVFDQIDIPTSDPPDATFNQSGISIGSVTLTVTYVYVPEPSSVVLLASGFVLIVVASAFLRRPRLGILRARFAFAVRSFARSLWPRLSGLFPCAK